MLENKMDWLTNWNENKKIPRHFMYIQMPKGHYAFFFEMVLCSSKLWKVQTRDEAYLIVINWMVNRGIPLKGDTHGQVDRCGHQHGMSRV